MSIDALPENRRKLTNLLHHSKRLTYPDLAFLEENTLPFLNCIAFLGPDFTFPSPIRQLEGLCTALD
jgi:hypothetical protein